MNYWAIYVESTGALVAIATHLGTLPTGQAARSLGAVAPDLDAWQWDASTLALVPRQPARVIPKQLFISRFTDAEQREFLGFVYDATATAQQKKFVVSFERLLNLLDAVNLDAPNIANGVAYLETVGIIQPGRAAVVLS